MKKDTRTASVEHAITQFETDLWKNKLAFQRKDDAWSKKNKKMLIKSVLENYYIPPILLTNNNILDGLQRLTALKEFKNDKFSIEWCDNTEKKTELTFGKLNDNDKNKFLKYELIVCDVKNDDGTELSPQSQEEFFIRINENSIKLSANEKMMARANDKKRELVRQIAELKEMSQLSNKKVYTDKRFSQSGLIARCLTIIKKIENVGFGQKSVRNSTHLYLSKPFTSSDEQNKALSKAKKVLETMFYILNDDGIPPKSFGVIFESIFVAFYIHDNSINSYKEHAKEIKKIIRKEVCEELKQKQMGGGTKYDSISMVKSRIELVEKSVEKFNVDPKRQFTKEDKYKIWQMVKDKSEDG